MDAFDCVLPCLDALAGALATCTFDAVKMARALERGHLCATRSFADFLALIGRVPFREAHHVVGALVREAEAKGVELGGLPDATFAAAHPALASKARDAALDPALAVERRSLIGEARQERRDGGPGGCAGPLGKRPKAFVMPAFGWFRP